jgi:membrane protease YdiL (CAAX protease family)
MAENKSHVFISEAILCSIGLMVFSFFIHYRFPIRLLSFAALTLPAYIIGRNLLSYSDLKKIIGEQSSFRIIFSYSIPGLLTGLFLAAFYRWHLDKSLFPESLHLFVFAAALIGCLEELVFRGYIQEHVKNVNATFSILFSTISHTGYKCCLFLYPLLSERVDVGFLALWTLIAGILFGTMKHFSKSVFPSLIAHALFDILVYAEFIRAPWWVW